MRKIIIAGIAFVLLVGGFIVYMEIDKRKFIDSLAPPSPIVNCPVNVSETTRDAIRENKNPKFQEVAPDELLAAVNRIPEQFGYSEASTTYAKLETKRMSEEKLTIDERVAHAETLFYLYPNEYNRRALVLKKFVQSKGPNFHPRDGFSDEDIAELKELGIPVVRRGRTRIINPPPDMVLRRLAEEDAGKYSHIWRDFLSYRESSTSAPNTASLEGMGEDTVSSPNRSEVFPVTSESGLLGTSEQVHYEDGHVHEPPTPGHGTDSQPPTLTAAKSVEASGWEGLSLEQRDQAKAFFDQYGTEEGLRRFREMAPEAARQFERERRKPPVPSEPNDEPPTR